MSFESSRQVHRLFFYITNFAVRGRVDYWLTWGPWSRCSESCGKSGVQIRYRQCSITRSRQGCAGTTYQRRFCSYGNKCTSSLSDVFGKSGRLDKYRSLLLSIFWYLQ